MPQRKDEWELNKYSNLRYCVVCKQFFPLDQWSGGHPFHGKAITRVSPEKWKRMMGLLESTPNMEDEVSEYHGYDGDTEYTTYLQSEQYHQQKLNNIGNLHSNGNYSSKSTAVAWVAIGVIIFVIGLFIIVGLGR